MKTTRNYVILSRTLFFCCVFFIVVLFSDWFSGPFFFNRNYRVLKYILAFLVPGATTVFSCKTERTLNYLSNASTIIMSFFVIGLLIFNLLGIPQFSVYEMSSLFHISYALIAIFVVFFCVTITVLCNNGKPKGYERFFKTFFIGYIPMMITLYVLFYVGYRADDASYIINIIPFKGEIKTVLNDFSELIVMRTIGNIAFYSTLSLSSASFAKKNSSLWAFLAPFILCIVTETAQGIFSMGDADIDDVILNSAGALIGALLYKFLVQKARRKDLCSE